MLLWWKNVKAIFCAVKVNTYWRNNICLKSLINRCILLSKTIYTMLMASLSVASVGYKETQVSLWKSRQPVGTNIQELPRKMAENSIKYYFSTGFHPNRVEKRNQKIHQITLLKNWKPAEVSYSDPKCLNSISWPSIFNPHKNGLFIASM